MDILKNHEYIFSALRKTVSSSRLQFRSWNWKCCELEVGGVMFVPDLKVHDDLPLVHILCVNFHPVHSQRLQTQSSVITTIKRNGHKDPEHPPCIGNVYRFLWSSPFNHMQINNVITKEAEHGKGGTTWGFYLLTFWPMSILVKQKELRWGLAPFTAGSIVSLNSLSTNWQMKGHICFTVWGTEGQPKCDSCIKVSTEDVSHWKPSAAIKQ